MPQAPNPPQSSGSIGSSPLRIVLFGLPGAGKSSLIGALAQAVQAQEHVLRYRLVDPTNELGELQHKVYAGGPESTQEETVVYPLTLEPLGDDGQIDANHTLAIVIVDCAGKTAGELLAQRDPLEPDGRLAREILDADTLVLAVDGSATPAQLARNFDQFAEFLSLLQEGRAQRSDVAGLPVYLVSTKCDQLAQPDDTSLSWIDRIEERKLQIGERFRGFLAQHDSPAHPFGSIDLSLWATAVKRPPLADTPASPLEPYGVAELFRQCVESAKTFHQREIKAGARLGKAVAGSIAFVLILVVAAIVFSFTHSSGEMGPLDLKVESFLAREREQSETRKYQTLDARIKDLEAFEADPDINKLTKARRDAIRDLLPKLKTYRMQARAYEKKLADIPQPQDATSREQLDKIKNQLSDLEPPRGYTGDWSQTPLGQVREQWLRDADLILAAADEARKWYLRASLEADKLLGTGEAATLPARAKQFLDKTRPSFPEQDPDKPISRQTNVTYRTVLGFTSVSEARERWEEKKKELQILAARARN